MKILAATTIIGLFATAAQPAIAQATNVMPALPTWGQYGIGGIIGFLHWWTIAKTIPKMSDDNNKGMEKMAAGIEGIRSDLQDNLKQQLQCAKDRK